MTPAQKRKAFEKVIADVGVSITKIAEAVEQFSISSAEASIAFGHLGNVMNQAHQRSQFAAQTNDAANFSLSSPSVAPAPLMPTTSPIVGATIGEVGGRFVQEAIPGAALPQPKTEVDTDGSGMMMA